MSKTNCCVPMFLCGVLGTKTGCKGFVPTDTPKVTCIHLNSSGMCTCALMIGEVVEKLHTAFTKI